MEPKEAFGVVVRSIGLLIFLIIAPCFIFVAMDASSGRGHVGLLLTFACIGAFGLWMVRRPQGWMNFGFPGTGAKQEKDPHSFKLNEMAGKEFNNELLMKGRDPVPASGRVFLAAHTSHYAWMVECAKVLVDMGYEVISEGSSLEVLTRVGMAAKNPEDLPGKPVSVAEAVKAGELQFVFATGAYAHVAGHVFDRGVHGYSDRSEINTVINAMWAKHA